MEALLQTVLLGDLPWQLALAWALSSGENGPPPELKVTSGFEGLSPSQAQPIPFRPVDFRTHILNHVREQAELILAAAEQEGGLSHPPTPEALSRGKSASNAPRQPPAGLGAGQQLANNRQHAQLQRASRRLEPGLLDDNNFPSLGLPAPKPTSPSGKKKKQVAALALVCCRHLLAAHKKSGPAICACGSQVSEMASGRVVYAGAQADHCASQGGRQCSGTATQLDSSGVCGRQLCHGRGAGAGTGHVTPASWRATSPAGRAGHTTRRTAAV
jgi:hypothetical protein